MTNVFLSCQHLFVANAGGLSSVKLDFLRGCNTNEAVDQWCGDFILSTLKLDDESNSKGPSNSATKEPPSSVNGAKFDDFAMTWKHQLALDITWFSIFDRLLAICWWGCEALEASLKQEKDAYDRYLESSATPPRKSLDTK